MRSGITRRWLRGNLLLTVLLSALVVKAVLPEEGSFPAVAASCCLASFAGAMLSVRRSSWGSLASAMVSAAGFLLAVVAVALLCWQQITWLGRGGVLLLCGALSFPVLLLIAVLASGINGFLGSATDAMLRSIIDIRYYPKVRSLNEGRDATIAMAGSPIGGFLYSVAPWLPWAASPPPASANMVRMAGTSGKRMAMQRRAVSATISWKAGHGRCTGKRW